MGSLYKYATQEIEASLQGKRETSQSLKNTENGWPRYVIKFLSFFGEND
jgi:hypothetical protein